jgi:MFS family permease
MNNSTAKKLSPFTIRNVRMFVAFRVFFNARFYYPVFTILFLDFGLSISQFAILNTVWAATIVVMEVPSGALADIWGRRNLLILASILMIIEMLLLCFVPRGYSSLLFTVFLINRILSGTAEAAASGADEAIAYDTLKIEGHIEMWDEVLAMQMKMRSLASIMAMALGAAVYDPAFMQRVSDWLGLGIHFSQSITIRIPIYLTLIMAMLSLISTLRMQKENFTITTDETCGALEHCSTSVKDIFAKTLEAGRWILSSPFALVIIGAGFLFDSIIRMIVTLASQYYRLIEIPEALFGIIGSGMAIIGLIIPRLCMKMTERYTPRFNLSILAATTIVGLFGMSFFTPRYGLIPVVIIFSGIYMSGFFVSFYLNHITKSSQRATVLSFKGLSFNLFYGLVGLLYAVLIAALRPQVAETHAGITPELLENLVFITSFQWFPWTFVIGLILFLLFAAHKLKSSKLHQQVRFKQQGDPPG